MPLDTHGYDDFVAAQGGFDNPQSLEVRIDPAINGGADILAVYTGTVLLSRVPGPGAGPFEGQSSEKWSRGVMKIHVPTPGRRWLGALPQDIPQPTQPTHPGLPETLDTPFTYFLRGTVVVSLASIFNKGASKNAGWAVDGAEVYGAANEDEGLRIQAKIAVSDSDGVLYRLAYQVTALGKGPRPGIVSPDPSPT